jgi:leucyl aminopeptidase
MRFQCSQKALGEASADAGALFAWRGSSPRGSALHRMLDRRSKADGFRGNAGEIFLYHAPDGSASPRYLLVGLGPEARGNLESLRTAAAALSRRLRRLGARNLALQLPAGGPLRGAGAGALGQTLAEGLLLGGFCFDRYLSENTGEKPLRRVEVLLGKQQRAAVQQGLRRGTVYAQAANLTRTLVSEPPSELTPMRMAAIARKEARRAGVTCKVMRRAELEKRGMGGILGVSRGSAEEPCLIHLRYRPRRRAGKHVVLVGKGITFDSGGLSLKASVNMETMKSDMAGAAAVLAVMQALPDLKVPVAVDGLLCMSENMPSGTAQKPGDILRTYSGKTVEVTNTDAEGRLVLADGLAYAAGWKPDEIIDIATLTGGCVVALGPAGAGLMSNHDALARALLSAAGSAGEKVWQLPLYHEYLDMMRSPVADLKNSGARWGSAITAGLFLQEFVPTDIPWAHLDIAGPAFLDRPHGAFPKGATGAGVRTLLHHLQAS